MVQSREEEAFHNTHDLERMIYARVQNGDVDFFRRDTQVPEYKVGKVADSSLRQAKNIFIINVTLATRAAMAGGLSEEIAYQLSDEYIQTVENMISLNSIEHLSLSMLRDFTERVRESSLPLHDIPEDISRVFTDVCAHRIIMSPQAKIADVSAVNALEDILRTVPEPSVRG